MGMLAVDADRNGMVSADEAAAFADMMFDRLDSDGDESLSRDDFMSMPGGTGRPMPAAASRREEHFKQMDSNNDGNVDHGEFIAWHQARYKAADINKDGQVDPWELRTAMRLGRTRQQ